MPYTDMNEIRFFCTSLLSLSVICAVYLLFYSKKRTKMPGAKYFYLLMFTAIIYNGCYVGEINSNQFRTALFWFNAEHLAIPVQHYLWALMGLEYAMVKKRYINIAKYLLLYHPVLYTIIFYTNGIHHSYISSYRFESNGFFPVIFSTKGNLFFLMVASGTFLGCSTVYCYIKAITKSPKSYRSGYIIMIIACIFPWISVYLNASNLNYLGIDYFPLTTFFSGILYLYGIFGLRIFKTIPIATEMVFRQSREGILLLDIADRIIDYNDTFLKLYPEDLKKHRRHSIHSFLTRNPELYPLLEDTNKFEFSRNYDGEKRVFSVSVNPIMAEDGFGIGKMVYFEDITPYAKKQESLEHLASDAMNIAEMHEISFLQAQISPHFINNTLSVIASMITRAPEEAKELITNLGEYLAERYYFDSKSVTVLLDHELETVDTYVRIEKARFRERLNYHLICEQIPDVKIPRMVLQPLIENAIRHGILKKADGGNVWLRIICRNDELLIEIQDDGVGISEEKLAGLLTDDSNVSSIGLINIHKRLLKYYNKGLNIQSTHGVGTIVSLTIPFSIII
ncbi:histidine kinase N-terminal 7TM domain-containing protein [Anaerocolumna sp. MB42-C2]|uniref:histidine kinase N-terminal 7TM domain-containing protein n=1 Tax=Anaerocolumna sp. MB42-C2 TaxID=3070997 RepID=UPI0027E0D6F3|nr:histidine kinase N-terminal 7TM domain-containing protein [Anaerocolumna sp. MB42-C2]WMJ89899.1 histidine kinase N-terminal 7TM domain-containing protein [Anaerocolumna sp. MB42-C2]